MKTITDEAVLAFLLDLKEKTTLLDSDGRVIGHFDPADPKDAETYPMVVRFYDAEEIARRKANPGVRRTTAEVLARLHALHPLPQDQPEDGPGSDPCETNIP